MAAYSGDVDTALTAKLQGDGTLMGLMPHGVFFDIGGTYADAAGVIRSATKFVLVKLMGHTIERLFGGRAFEAPVYLVKAVEQSSNPATTKAAAARIDVLLDGGTLTIPGYGLMQMELDEYVRYAETDPDNNDARWQHRGGMYALWVSP